MDRQSAAAVEGALVLLLDEAGATKAGYLTNEAGRFLLRAPGPGTYVLRGERVGYETVTSEPFHLASSQTLNVLLETAQSPILLEELRVEWRQRCVVRPGEGLEAHCGEGEGEPGASAVVGKVWSGVEGNPAPGAVVTLEWSRYRSPGGGIEQLQADIKRIEALTDDGGRFRMCGVPPGVLVTVRAASGGRRSPSWTLMIPAAAVTVVDLTLHTRGTRPKEAAIPQSPPGRVMDTGFRQGVIFPWTDRGGRWVSPPNRSALPGVHAV